MKYFVCGYGLKLVVVLMCLVLLRFMNVLFKCCVSVCVLVSGIYGLVLLLIMIDGIVSWCVLNGLVNVNFFGLVGVMNSMFVILFMCGYCVSVCVAVR